MLRLLLATYDSVELALLSANSPLVMGLGAVVVDGVALVEYLNIVAHLHLKLTADDNIHFLTLMGMGVRNSVLLVNIGNGNEERLCYLVAELGSQSQVAQTLSSGDGKALACPCDVEAPDMGRFSLHKVGYLHAAGICELVYEAEAEVLCAALIGEVLI